MEPLTAGAIAAALVLAVALVLALRSSAAALRAHELRREAGQTRERELEHAGGRLETRCEQLRERCAELDAELERHRGDPLEGRTVIANTEKPDDQAIRGVVMRRLEDGGLLLAGAVYLEPAGGREGIREVPAGDVVVHRPSWTQILTPQEG